MSALPDNLRVYPERERSSADIEREDRDMCARIRRSVNAEDVINELWDHRGTLNTLLHADRPDVRLIGGLVLAVFNDYKERLIAQARAA